MQIQVTCRIGRESNVYIEVVGLQNDAIGEVVIAIGCADQLPTKSSGAAVTEPATKANNRVTKLHLLDLFLFTIDLRIKLRWVFRHNTMRILLKNLAMKKVIGGMSSRVISSCLKLH